LIKRAGDAQQVYFTTRAEQVADEPLVQMIDEVVNRLDMTPLYACWSEKGRAFYDPSMMLKVLFFAYSEGERHSRGIAKRIKYDVRYQYFTGSHRPSYVTICRFRTIDVELLAKYFVEIVSICAELGLLDTTVLAIDGTKIKASASRRRTLLQKDWDRLTARYKALLSADAASDRADIGSEAHDDHRDDSDESQVKEVDRKSLNVRIVEAMKRLGSGEREVNLTDGDARFMKTSEGSIRPCYNGQIASEEDVSAVGTSYLFGDTYNSFTRTNLCLFIAISRKIQHHRHMLRKLSTKTGQDQTRPTAGPVSTKRLYQLVVANWLRLY